MVGIYDQDQARARERAEAAGVPRVYAGWQEVLDDPEVQCVGVHNRAHALPVPIGQVDPDSGWWHLDRSLQLGLLLAAEETLTESRSPVSIWKTR